MTTRRLLLCVCAGLAAAGCGGDAPKPRPAPEEKAGPVLFVPSRTQDAGVVDNTKTYDNTFLLTNKGDEPLEVTIVHRSCSCGEVTGPDKPIPPKGSGEVKFHWATPPGSAHNTSYTLAADLVTNDPKAAQVRLEIKAEIVPTIRIDPPVSYVDFEKIEQGQQREKILKVFSTKLDQFDLKATMEGKHFTVQSEPIPRPELLPREKSGYRVTIKTAKDVPPGYLHGRLTLVVKAGADERTFDIPVYGDVSHLQFDVTPRQVDFTQPRITQADTKRVRVKFVLPTGQEKLQVRAEPSWLKVSEPVEKGKGLWEFSVSIPEDNPEAAKYQIDAFFEGRLFIKTGQGNDEFQVRVKWQPPGQ